MYFSRALLGFIVGGIGVFVALANGTADLLVGPTPVLGPIFYVSGLSLMGIGALFLRGAGGIKVALRLVRVYK